MTKLYGSRFADLLPAHLAGQTEVQALSYAVGRQVERLLREADSSRLYAAIYALPEKVLDLLAAELRTPAYQQTYSIQVKRALVEGALSYYARMGTPSACNKLIESIFGTGYIEEWFAYDGAPHHFRAYVGGRVDEASLLEFRRALSSVQRLSSWLDDIIATAKLPPAQLSITGRLGRGYMQATLPQIVPSAG